MIDPVTSLAFSMFANKGVYALLLGSGVSSAAGIPTGWDVVLDLIRKVAAIERDDPEPDPAAWYEKKFGEAPGYSSLLSRLAKRQAERNRLMRSYFEPTEEEREQGLKQPTAAHTSIARLVARGYVRVILTTNFDHLMEDALRALGIEPNVVLSPDGIEGMLPLSHSNIVILKLHGDYVDTRSMNTDDELAIYDPRQVALLDRVLDEFGLIVCGWSGEWDAALRAAIERCTSRRFTTFWASRGEPRDAARRLVSHRDAEIIRIDDANSFFQRLAENVVSLEEFAKPHPVSVDTAIATVKRYIADDRNRIRLFDLVTSEADRLFEQLAGPDFAFHSPSPTKESFVERVRAFESHSSMLLSMTVTGCFWSEPQHLPVWQEALSRVGRQAHPWGGNSAWTDLSLYPALLILYGGGIAAIAGNRYDALRALLDANIATLEGQKAAACALSAWQMVRFSGVDQWLPGVERHFTPVSDYLFDVLRDPIRSFLPDEQAYIHCFDRFEYLLGLAHIDRCQESDDYAWGPVGSFGWRNRHTPEKRIMPLIQREIDDAGDSWPPLVAGMFGSSLARLENVKPRFDEFVREVSRRWH